MSNPISEEELQVAEELLGAVLVLHQFGEEGLNPERTWDKLSTQIEHFLRRGEKESAYYERFGDHNLDVVDEPLKDWELDVINGTHYSTLNE